MRVRSSHQRLHPNPPWPIPTTPYLTRHLSHSWGSSQEPAHKASWTLDRTHTPTSPTQSWSSRACSKPNWQLPHQVGQSRCCRWSPPIWPVRCAPGRLQQDDPPQQKIPATVHPSTQTSTQNHYHGWPTLHCQVHTRCRAHRQDLSEWPKRRNWPQQRQTNPTISRTAHSWHRGVHANCHTAQQRSTLPSSWSNTTTYPAWTSSTYTEETPLSLTAAYGLQQSRTEGVLNIEHLRWNIAHWTIVSFLIATCAQFCFVIPRTLISLHCSPVKEHSRLGGR